MSTRAVKTTDPSVVAWESACGRVFRVRVRNEEGKTLEPAMLLSTATLCAMAEFGRGGDPSVVLGAFRVNLHSTDGHPLLPIPEEERADLDSILSCVRPERQEGAEHQHNRPKRVVEDHDTVAADRATPVGRQRVPDINARTAGQLGGGGA